MLKNKKHIAIIGGGITGLTAAYYLQKAIREKHLPYEVTVIEASHRLGGQLQTYHKDGYVIERGPDCFFDNKENVIALAIEVGLGDQLVNNVPGNTFIVAREHLHSVPNGAVLRIPTEIRPFIQSKLFSFPGKLRAAGDIILPKSPIKEDQSLGAFFRRRFGDEVVENLIEPSLSGIYAGDIDKMSLMSLFPHFYQLEQKYRSIILGMKKTTSPALKQLTKEKGLFVTFKTGMQSLADGIAKKLNPSSVKLGFRVESIDKIGQQYKVELNGGEVLRADSIIMAVPHEKAHQILPEYEFLKDFKHVPSTSIATVALSFSKEAIEKDMDATEYVVSRNSDYTMTSCAWFHKKWPHTTPDGKALLRCFVGRAGGEVVVDLSDDQIVSSVLADLRKTMKIKGQPELSVVTRWIDSMPQYTVGHIERMNKSEQGLAIELPGIFLAGHSYHGLGISACVKQGEDAVTKVLDYLMSHSKEEISQIS
jgi:oxygen-dependent protoporphyrinogen oxidase